MSNTLAVRGNNEGSDSAYLKILGLIIDKIKVDTNQPALDEVFAAAMAKSWKQHLKDRHNVPASKLELLYQSALDYRAKNDVRNSFSVQDMIAAWYRHIQSRRSADATKPYKNNFCSECKSNGGFIIVIKDGKPIQIQCDHKKEK